MADLDKLTRAAAGSGGTAEGGTRRLPPVHLWNPPFCGDIDMRIAADGTWYYLKTPIGRMALVKLFSTILRKDADRYVLVTPVERVGIAVDDVPFLAVEMRVAGAGSAQTLSFRTNVDDWTTAGPEHPLRFETGAADGLKPYVHVRADLWARLTRSLCHDLAGRGETRTVDGVAMFGVISAGTFFAMAPAEAIDAM
jgi:uncharacterized protein